MRCIALEEGYDGICVRRPDAVDEDKNPVVFDMPDGSEADDGSSWFTEVNEDGKPVKALAKKVKRGVPGAGPSKPAPVDPAS